MENVFAFKIAKIDSVSPEIIQGEYDHTKQTWIYPDSVMLSTRTSDTRKTVRRTGPNSTFSIGGRDREYDREDDVNHTYDPIA